MDDLELLSQIEHVSDIFTRIILRTMTEDLSGGASDEITVAQFQALRHIAQHGPNTVGGIAEGLSISQPAATMLVDRMAKRGLVERESGHEDRRKTQITLTDRAESLIRRVEHERMSRLGRIMESMQPGERRQLAESLEKFIAAAMRVERSTEDACLRCGREHQPDCVVNQTHLEMVGEDVECV